MKILFVLIAILVLLVIFPLATIWSLNTLFPALAIPFTLDTWMATLILSGIVSGSSGFTYRGNK